MMYLRLAWVFVVMMVIVSVAFNFAFGWRLGEHSYTVTQHVHDGFIYGTLSIAADGFKIVFGVLALHFFMARDMGRGMRALGFLACGILFLGATLYSLNSAIGSISTNRTDSAGLREAKATNYDAVKARLERAQKEQSWLDQEYRAAAAVEADLAGLRQSSLWSRTAGCTNVTATDSRTFCQKYSALQSELGTSRRAEELDAKVSDLAEKLVGMGGAIIADPHAKMIHDLTGYGQSAIVLAWLLLIVALVEGGSTIGPIALSLAHRAIRSAATASEASEATTLPAITVTAPPAPAPRAEMRPISPALAKLAGVAEPEVFPDATKNLNSSEIPMSSPNSAKSALNSADGADFDGPGTPVAKPEPAEEVAEAKTTNDGKVVYAQFGEDSTSPLTPRSKKKPQRGEGKAEAWLAAVTTQTDNPKDTVSSGDCWKSYLAYCHAENKHPIHRRAFSRQIGVLLRREAGRGGKRDRHGSVFTGLKLNPTITMKARRAA